MAVIQSKKTHYKQQRDYREMELLKKKVRKGLFAEYLDSYCKVTPTAPRGTI